MHVIRDSAEESVTILPLLVWVKFLKLLVYHEQHFLTMCPSFHCKNYDKYTITKQVFVE